MSNVWVPNGAKIQDKICIISAQWPDYKLESGQTHSVSFSPKLNENFAHTLSVVDNSFSGPFRIGKIRSYSSSFGADIYMKNIISTSMDVVFKTSLKYWEVNEIIQSGVIGEGGNIKDGAEFVILTYGGYCCPILKGAPIYNEVMGI